MYLQLLVKAACEEAQITCYLRQVSHVLAEPRTTDVRAGDTPAGSFSQWAQSSPNARRFLCGKGGAEAEQMIRQHLSLVSGHGQPFSWGKELNVHRNWLWEALGMPRRCPKW